MERNPMLEKEKASIHGQKSKIIVKQERKNVRVGRWSLNGSLRFGLDSYNQGKAHQRKCCDGW